MTTWSTANVSSYSPQAFSNQTIRNIVHITIGGGAVRIRLANTFNAQRVHFDAVYIGIEKDGAALMSGTNHAVTFGGNRSITIPDGAEVLSDPVPLTIQSEQSLAISLFIGGDTGRATIHESAFQTNYLSEKGNAAADETAAAFTKTTTSWYFLSAVDVLAAPDVKGVIVALGDSITDGASSRVDKNERWADVLARRLLTAHAGYAVVNAGIGGNCVLTTSPCWGANALARVGHDVLSQSGVRVVILFEGTNDIGQPDTPVSDSNPCLSRTPITADELIAGYKQIIARSHARGLKIIGATILPYQGFSGWTPAGEAKRVAVNEWIRSAGAFDGIIDFDKVIRDPANPTRMIREYDSGDHLHPGTAGHAAMGNAIELGQFP